MTSVSVVIACFNAGKDLKKAILSVLQQSHRSIELIIQDGGSTDSTTISILEEFKNECSVFVEKDNGIFDAFQRGIEKSNSEWIYLMGADDQLASEDVIERLMKYDFLSTYDLMMGRVENVDSISQWIPTHFISEMNARIYWRNTIHQQGCLYRRSLLDKTPLNTHYKILGDYHLHLQLYLQGKKALSTPLTFAVCQADGLSKKFTWDLYREEIKIKLSLLRFPLNLITSMGALFKFSIKKVLPRSIQ